MSRVTIRKRILQEVLKGDFPLPTKNQRIVRILKSRGDNVYKVEAADKSVILAYMSAKFRKIIWVKRGDYVLVQIEKAYTVRARMVKILMSEHIKQFKEDKVWPQEFTDSKEEKKDTFEEDDLFVNRNRPIVSDESSSDSDFSGGDYCL